MAESFTKSPEGIIAYYGLQRWWLSTFTAEEQRYINSNYQPLTMEVGDQQAEGNSSGLTTGSLSWCSQSVVSLLTILSAWFNNKNDRGLAQRILEKAYSLAKQGEGSTLDRHFLHQAVAQTYYPQRDSDPSAFERAVAACRDQIAMTKEAKKAFQKEFEGAPLPSHHGYKQVSVILEKQNKYREALELCKRALGEGWQGDWNARIERLQKKLK
jgi:hypothetical protein